MRGQVLERTRVSREDAKGPPWTGSPPRPPKVRLEITHDYSHDALCHDAIRPGPHIYFSGLD